VVNDEAPEEIVYAVWPKGSKGDLQRSVDDDAIAWLDVQCVAKPSKGFGRTKSSWLVETDRSIGWWW